MAHLPLSKELEHLLGDQSLASGVSINDLLLRTKGRGIYLLLILLSLPFLTPVPLPGVSNILGVIMMFMAMRLSLNLPARLPQFIGRRPISPKRFEKFILASVMVLRFTEKCVRPRHTQWLGWRVARCGNALLLAFMALILALPIPPVIPFSNSLPSYSIILLAASMMEQDGWMIWLGYAMCLGTVVYLVSVAELIRTLVVKYSVEIQQFIQSLL